MKRNLILFLAVILLAGCATFSKKQNSQKDISKSEKDISMKKVSEMTPEDVNIFVADMREKNPVFGDRVAAIARRNLGLEYKLYLLGEFPFEIYDADPLYSLDKGDCVVFSEHTYAMALGYDWQSFFAFLQRIRYKNGEISTITRNHYTLTDWDMNNAWLIKDISKELAGDKTKPVTEDIDRTKFFKERYKLDTNFEKENKTFDYIPAEEIPAIASQLKNGDFVNVIRGTKDSKSLWAGHVGLITKNEDGSANFLHCTPPVSVEVPLTEYIKKELELNKERAKNNKALFFGMKFLRPYDDPIANLLKIDGPDAPVVTGPKGLIRKMPEKFKK